MGGGICGSSRLGEAFVAKTEEPVDSLGIGRLRFFVRQRLELFGGIEQELFHDQPRELIEEGARLGWQARELRVQPLQFGPADGVDRSRSATTV